MIPSPRLLRLLGGGLALAVAAALLPALLPLWIGFVGAVALALAGEALLLRRQPDPRLRRQAPTALAIGQWQPVRLRLETPAAGETWIEVFDGAPPAFEVEGLPQRLSIPGQGWAALQYRLRPRERGAFAFSPVEVRLAGRLGLLQRQRRLTVEDAPEMRVYPDFQQVARYALLALDHRVNRMGIHLQRRRGQGLEFFQLREFRDGDSLRQIDWKAVSRRHQLISREYREEQDQRVVFLLDCGRRMRAMDGDIAHFDQALNAVLLLSYVALRQGDSVGLLTFGGPQRWLPPVKGRAGLSVLLNTVFDLQTTTEPPDYAAALSALAARQRRRSLVVLLTNLRDDDSDELPAAIAPIRRRHLLLVASLREPALQHALQAPIHDLKDALTAAATCRYLQQRRRVHESLRGRGVLTIDVEPAQLPVALVNRYLEIKRAGML